VLGVQDESLIAIAFYPLAKAIALSWWSLICKMRSLFPGGVRFVRCDRLPPILDTQIAAIVNRVEASPRSVQVRELGYRWGSCGHKGDLYFHAPCGDASVSDD
jgi:hypothetical protein